MKIIGVTGVFGSGKSSVARMFADLGAYLIDHDKINHDLLKKGEPGYAALLAEYGRGILNADGEILRSKVAELAFMSEESVRRICALLHPLIIEVEEELASEYKREGMHDMIIVDSPLLFEAGRDKVYDSTVVVSADEQHLLERIKRRFDMDKDEARRRLFFQMSIGEKVKRAEHVIENNGTLDELLEKVKDLFKKIKDGY